MRQIGLAVAVGIVGLLTVVALCAPAWGATYFSTPGTTIFTVATIEANQIVSATLSVTEGQKGGGDNPCPGDEVIASLSLPRVGNEGFGSQLLPNTVFVGNLVDVEQPSISGTNCHPDIYPDLCFLVPNATTLELSITQFVSGYNACTPYAPGTVTVTFTVGPVGHPVVNAYDANIEYTSGVFIPTQTSDALARLADPGWLDSAREVTGVAADGVSLVLLRGKVRSSHPVSGDVHFTLEKGSVDAPLGSLWAVDDQSLTDTTSAGGARDQLDAGGGGSVDDGPTELTVTPVNLNGEQWIFAVYRAPRNFDDAGVGTVALRERTITIHATLPGSETDDQTIELTIVRPLVLFMHGTWDKPSTWDHFPLYADSATAVNDYAGGAEPFYSDTLEFASLKHAAGPVLQNATHVLPQMIDKLGQWRKKIGVAATQADVVTHSYGGPTMRYVAQTQGDAYPLTRDSMSFRRAENWGHGYMHKLITLAATHRGSALANHAAAVNRISGGVLNSLLRSQNHDIDLGGAEDQFVLSDALLKLHQTRVPGHTFVGSGVLDFAGDPLNDTLNTEVAPFSLAWLLDRPGGPYKQAGTPSPSETKWDFQALRRLTNYSFNLSYTVGGDSSGDPNYDLTVSSVSARGEMTNAATSGISALPGVAPGTLTHLHDTSSVPLSTWAEYLLKKPIGSGAFAYFPVPSPLPLTQAEVGLSNRQDYNPAWLLLTPLSPLSTAAATRASAQSPILSTDASGDTVTPGQPLQVSLSWPGKQIDLTMLLWPDADIRGGITFLNGDTPSFTLTVPQADPGPFPISAVVYSTTGKTDVASVQLEIADPNQYTSIQSDPPAVSMQTTYSTPLRVYGKTADGQIRDVTASAGTAIVSADPTIVTVTADRLLQPINFGSTTLQVTVRDAGQISVPASVQGSPVAVKALLPGKHPTLHLESGRQVDFAFLSGTGFDASSLVASSIWVGGARPVRFEVKDVNHDNLPDLVVSVVPQTLPGLAPGSVQIPMIGTTNTGSIFGGVVTVNAK